MASIVLPQKSCGNKIPVPQSLYWRPSTDQKARGLWVRDWRTLGTSTGAHPLTKKPEDSGYEIGYEIGSPRNFPWKWKSEAN